MFQLFSDYMRQAGSGNAGGGPRSGYDELDTTLMPPRPGEHYGRGGSGASPANAGGSTGSGGGVVPPGVPPHASHYPASGPAGLCSSIFISRQSLSFFCLSFVIILYFLISIFWFSFYIAFNPGFKGGYNNPYGSVGEVNGGMGRADDSIGYDPNNSVFDNDQGGHYNNVPNPMINANSSNPNNPVVMMQMTTPVPQLSGQGDVNYNTGAPRAAFEDDEHQRQIRLMHQGIGEQPPVMQRPKSSMSGQQSRGLFLFYFVVSTSQLFRARQ